MLNSLTGDKGERGRRHFSPLLFALTLHKRRTPSHAASQNPCRAAGSCVAQCWLSAHNSISTPAHYLHKISRMEILPCCSPERSAFVERHGIRAHSQGAKSIRPELYRNRSPQEQIWVSKWCAVQHISC